MWTKWWWRLVFSHLAAWSVIFASHIFTSGILCTFRSSPVLTRLQLVLLNLTISFTHCCSPHSHYVLILPQYTWNIFAITFWPNGYKYNTSCNKFFYYYQTTFSDITHFAIPAKGSTENAECASRNISWNSKLIGAWLLRGNTFVCLQS